MPVIRMTHEIHGNHICYTPEDVEEHERQGWKRYEKPALMGLRKVEDTQIEKKRGRKPKCLSQPTMS